MTESLKVFCRKKGPFEPIAEDTLCLLGLRHACLAYREDIEGYDGSYGLPDRCNTLIHRATPKTTSYIFTADI